MDRRCEIVERKAGTLSLQQRVNSSASVFRKKTAVLAEIQGLYGAFSFPEKLLQKIWLRGDFDRGSARLVDGREVRVLYPGKWNLLGGPDFKGARLRFGDHEITGDVELHLHAADWDAHGHANDPAYADVVLHVVLFPLAVGYETRDAHGKVIPALSLLPLLLHDLEEYAAAEAVETLANRPGLRAVEELGKRSSAELTSLVRRHAQARWRQKVHFARLRVERLGWIEACHHVALEILGYRFNRVPMLRIAAQFPAAQWLANETIAENAFAAERDAWSLQGVRPANYPRLRLRQYAAWQRSCPDWMVRLEGEVGRLALSNEAGARPKDWAEDTVTCRRHLDLTKCRGQLAETLCGHQVSGTRFDNLVCDGFLPLVAARTGGDFEAAWFHWLAGDQPRHVLQALRALGLIGSRKTPACHGAAQGFLGWLIDREARAARLDSGAVSTGAGSLTKFPADG
jgi:hypothetical protein